jgi:hypothetical protein
MTERDKYIKAWSYEGYRGYSPGEYAISTYIGECNPKRTTIIDFGTGTGRGALALYNLGFEVTMVDIADNCLDRKVADKLGRNLVIGNLWEHLDLPRADEGYCTDVMEHIPPEHVEAVVKNIMGLCKRAFFQICLVEDKFGEVIGEQLHLTVESFDWWKDLLSRHGAIISCGDMDENGWFYIEA